MIFHKKIGFNLLIWIIFWNFGKVQSCSKAEILIFGSLFHVWNFLWITTMITILLIKNCHACCCFAIYEFFSNLNFLGIF
jgi:hypothetical protein